MRLDTLVTVVDAREFLRNFSSSEVLGDRDWEINNEDDRTIVDLLVEQIEFCDVLIVNKISEVPEEKLPTLRAILK